MTNPGIADGRPSLVEVQAAARQFLQAALPDVHRVDITRVVPIESVPEAWQVEAVAWQPNATLQALGLSTRRPVLDPNAYVVRLDGRLNVIAYETKEAEGAS